MLKYLFFCTLLAPAVLGAPLPLAQSDIASHIVIVTPQAHVHLEPNIKYDPAAFIHHLSPLARIGAPHEESIVYVPTSAGGAIIPVENVSVGRASANEQPQKLETKQWDQISQQIQQAVQTGSSQLGPQFSEAAAAASSAAAAAGQGLFPALFPPAGPASSGSSATSVVKEDKPKISYGFPANTEALLPSNARIYALTPAVPHVVDFTHSPIFLGPISAIRARSIQDGGAQTPLPTVPILEDKSEELSLNDKTKGFKEANPIPSQKELDNNPDHNKFFGVNALKEEETKLSDASEAKKEKPSEYQFLDTNYKPETLMEGHIETALPAQPPKLKIQPAVDVNVGVHKDVSKGVTAESQPQSKVA